MKGRPLVLIVDDSADIRTTLGDLLEGSLQYPVLTARSGPEALGLLEALPRDGVNLIVADFRMEPMNGIEFLENALATHPDVPRVLMTAYPDLDLAIGALHAARISHFLRKPLDPEATVHLAKTLIARHAAAVDRQAALQRAVQVSNVTGDVERLRPRAAG